MILGVRKTNTSEIYQLYKQTDCVYCVLQGRYEWECMYASRQGGVASLSRSAGLSTGLSTAPSSAVYDRWSRPIWRHDGHAKRFIYSFAHSSKPQFCTNYFILELLCLANAAGHSSESSDSLPTDQLFQTVSPSASDLSSAKPSSTKIADRFSASKWTEILGPGSELLLLILFFDFADNRTIYCNDITILPYCSLFTVARKQPSSESVEIEPASEATNMDSFHAPLARLPRMSRSHSDPTHSHNYRQGDTARCQISLTIWLTLYRNNKPRK